MDTTAIEKAGLTPLNDVMQRIDAIKDSKDLMAEVAREHMQGIGQLFGLKQVVFFCIQVLAFASCS